MTKKIGRLSIFPKTTNLRMKRKRKGSLKREEKCIVFEISMEIMLVLKEYGCPIKVSLPSFRYTRVSHESINWGQYIQKYRSYSLTRAYSVTAWTKGQVYRNSIRWGMGIYSKLWNFTVGCPLLQRWKNRIVLRCFVAVSLWSMDRWRYNSCWRHYFCTHFS